MDEATVKLSKYIHDKGINLTKLSVDTGIPYGAIYASISDKRRCRDLRAGEFLKICNFLGVEAEYFMESEKIGK